MNLHPFRKENGFTLVELAISLMVIGLLIGGVLKGQDLIDNARAQGIARQIEAYQSAAHIFLTTYEALPGDIANPGDRIPNCSASPCNLASAAQDGFISSNGSGQLVQISSITFVNTGEPAHFFNHLANAGLISDVDSMTTSTTNAAWGDLLPGIKDGTDNGVAIFGYGAQTGYGTPILTGNYFIIRNGTDNGLALKPATALYLDQKLDDGNPWGGIVRATGNISQNPVGNSCLFNTGNYREDVVSRQCNVLIRLDAGTI